jgi:hypothetical protein
MTNVAPGPVWRGKVIQTFGPVNDRYGLGRQRPAAATARPVAALTTRHATAIDQRTPPTVAGMAVISGHGIGGE